MIHTTATDAPGRVSSQDRISAPAIVGDSACMASLRSMLEAVSGRSCTILIHGETGTGKELVARRLHAEGDRAAGPFIPVDCTALRDTLFESQLFGHVKGAFTGAERSTLGFFRAADGGTLFLDEIGELPQETQAKLLRCIQDQAVVPLGAVTPIPVNVRIVVATHRDLKDMVRQGRFREDLYYRINVVRLEVPPLRERRDDILPLAEHFLAQQGALYDEPVKKLDERTRECLLQYCWPGNVRELANAMERAHVFAQGRVVTSSVLPAEVARPDAEEGRGCFPTLAESTRRLIREALEYTGGRKIAAAELLGIERRRLNRLLRDLNIGNAA